MDVFDVGKRYGPRILASITSFLMIIWGAQLLPLLSVFTEPRGLIISIVLGTIAGFFAYINRNRIAAFLVTLIVVGSLVYHVLYFFVVKAALPVELTNKAPAIIEMLSDPVARAMYISIAILVLIIALVLSATIKHPLELVSYYISLTALLLFITPYAYLSIPLLFAALSAAQVVKVKSIKGLGLFFLIYFSILLPINIAYRMVDYGLEESGGDPVLGIIYAVSYYSPISNRTIPVFVEISRDEVVHGELLLSARLSELVLKFRSGSLKPKLEELGNLPYDEIRDRIAAALVVLTKNILIDYSIPILVATATIWFGLILGVTLYSYIGKHIQNLILLILRRSGSLLLLIVPVLLLPFAVIFMLWIGLIVGVYFFDALSALGYDSPTVIGNNLVLIHGLLLLVAMIYPPYVFCTFPTLLSIGERYRKRYIKSIEALLDKIGVSRGSLSKVIDLARTAQSTFKKIDMELAGLEDEIATKLSWLKHAKSLEILRSRIDSFIGRVFDRYAVLEVQLVEELRRVFNIRRSTLLEAVEVAKSLGEAVELPDRIVEAEPRKMMIAELIEALSELNRLMINTVNVLVKRYEEMGKSLALLDPEGEEILRSVKADVDSIKANIDYDPYMALESVLKTLVRFRDTYYDKLIGLWQTLVNQLSNILEESRGIVESSLFIEDSYKAGISEKLKLVEEYLEEEIEDISVLSKRINGVRSTILELIDVCITIIDHEASKASKLVGVERAIILDLSAIPPNYSMEITRTLRLVGSRTGVRAFIELAELMKRVLTYVDQISMARERCANFWIARRIIDKVVVEGKCIGLRELPFRVEHGRWMIKLYARIHYTDTTIELRDGEEYICPRQA